MPQLLRSLQDLAAYKVLIATIYCGPSPFTDGEHSPSAREQILPQIIFVIFPPFVSICASVETWPLHLLSTLHIDGLFYAKWQQANTLKGGIDKQNYAEEIPFLPNLESYALFLYTRMRSKNKGFSNTAVHTVFPRAR